MPLGKAWLCQAVPVVHCPSHKAREKAKIANFRAKAVIIFGVYAPDWSHYDGLCPLGPNYGFLAASIDFALRYDV